MAFQYDPPVTVYNGPDAGYKVKAVFDTVDAATQLIGIDDRWLDAFGRFRVSEPQTLFESAFTYDLQADLFETSTTNATVTHDADLRAAVLTNATDSGATAIIQSRQYHPYEKGRSQLVKITGTFGSAVANVTRRMGYYDGANGFYLEQTSSGVSLVRRSSVTGSLVNTSVAQASWNLDPLDGTGPSGATLDLSKGQILVIDGQWLGVGRVRMGFNIDGGTVWAHQFLHANETATVPYTQTFALPVRWEQVNTDVSAGATMVAICAEVESEGAGSAPTSLSFSAANTANISTSTTRTALLAIRPAADYPAGGSVNRQVISPKNVSVLSVGAAVLVEVFYNPTLTGGSWVRADATSATEYNLGATISSPGVLVSSFFVPSGGGQAATVGEASIASNRPLVLDISGANPRGLMVTATTTTGTGTARGTIDWVEVR